MTQKTITNGLLLRRIISFAKPFQKHLGAVFFCILATTALNALNNLFFGAIFDTIQKRGMDHASFTTALWLAGAAAVVNGIRIWLNGFQGKVEVSHLDMMIPNYLNHQSIAKFFSFSNGQHINEHSGVKQSIVTNGVNSIKNQIDLTIYQLFPAVAQFFIALFVICYAEWIIGLLFFATGSLFCIRMYQLNKKWVPGIKKIRNQKLQNSRLTSEMFRFVSLVKNESQEDRSLNDVELAQDKCQNAHAETWIPGIQQTQVVRLISSGSRIVSVFVAIYLLYAHELSIGGFFLVLTYGSQFIDSLWQMTNMHKQFLLDRMNIEKYFELLEVESDIVIPGNPVRPENFYGNIEFKNVSFYYPRRVESYEIEQTEGFQDDPVLRNVSFIIKSGEKIGIVGESGSGKSTLANLIRRGFDPQNGQIMIDGNDLRLIDLKWFLQHVGSVEQEVVMLDRSIRDNILFGLNQKVKQISEERLHELGKLARINTFFDRLEHGFDTMVGEKGIKLSGGERQRVGIARALAKNPSILIFDEATSALDSMSEQIVQQSIDDACKGKTAIIIAHRLSTVKNCDKILVFRHGILLAQGSHDQLLTACEYYAELVKYQMFAS